MNLHETFKIRVSWYGKTGDTMLNKKAVYKYL